MDFDYCPQCKKCLFCEKDVSIDMGCTMDLCSYSYLTLDNDFFDCIIVPEYKYLRDKQSFKAIDVCPFDRFVDAVHFIKDVDVILFKERL